METKQATVMAGLASGRSSHNCAKATVSAEFPPFPKKGVLWGGRPDRGHVPRIRFIASGAFCGGRPLASGRPLRNNAQAKFPPIPPKGVLFGKRPDKGPL